jgi:hypothetical protein
MCPAAWGDVSLGIEAATRRFNRLRFHLRESLLATNAMKRVISVMLSAEFHDAVAVLPGHLSNGHRRGETRAGGLRSTG